MTDKQRAFYLFLLICGRETEAIQYRDNCNAKETLQSPKEEATNNEKDQKKATLLQAVDRVHL